MHEWSLPFHLNTVRCHKTLPDTPFYIPLLLLHFKVLNFRFIFLFCFSMYANSKTCYSHAKQLNIQTMFVNHQLNIQACLISNCHLILSGPGQSYLTVITIIIQSIIVINCNCLNAKFTWHDSAYDLRGSENKLNVPLLRSNYYRKSFLATMVPHGTVYHVM